MLVSCLGCVVVLQNLKTDVIVLLHIDTHFTHVLLCFLPVQHVVKSTIHNSWAIFKPLDLDFM